MKYIFSILFLLISQLNWGFGQTSGKNPLILNIDSVPEIKLDFPITEGPLLK